MSSGLAALLFTEDADALSDTFEASYVAATSVFLEAVVLSMSLAAVFLPEILLHYSIKKRFIYQDALIPMSPYRKKSYKATYVYIIRSLIEARQK